MSDLVMNMGELPLGEIGQQTRVSRQKMLEVLENQGELSLIQACACKVRYFIDGAALGAKHFVEEVFHANRGCFGEMSLRGDKSCLSGVSLFSIAKRLTVLCATIETIMLYL